MSNKLERSPLFWSDFQNWLFAPDSAINLGVCRLLFFAGLFLLYWRMPFVGWADVPEVFYQPMSYFVMIPAPVQQHQLLQALNYVWLGAVVLSMLGLFTRIATAAAAIVGLYFLALMHNYGYMHHHEHPIVLILVILAFSRCGNAVSVDALFKAKGKTATFDDSNSAFGWPLHLIWIVLCFTYAAAGISKFSLSGVSWIVSDIVRDLIHISSFRDRIQLTDAHLFLASQPLLSSISALASLCLELLVPLMLFVPKSRWLILPGLIGMHLMLQFFNGISYPQYILCAVFWIPWDRIFTLRPRTGTTGTGAKLA